MSANHEDIQKVAYARYEGRGAVDGLDEEDWLWAENRLQSDDDIQSAIAVARLEAFINEFFKSQPLLEQRYGKFAELDEIQEAMKERLDIDDDLQLPFQRLSADSIVELIKDVDFEEVRPIAVETIVLDERILPPDLPTVFEEEVIKFKGEQWDIHQYDADPFPHPIHAHHRGSGLKMDIRNGRIYRKREEVSRMKKKDLQQLRDRIQHIRDVPALDY